MASLKQNIEKKKQLVNSLQLTMDDIKSKMEEFLLKTDVYIEPINYENQNETKLYDENEFVNMYFGRVNDINSKLNGIEKRMNEQFGKHCG